MNRTIPFPSRIASSMLAAAALALSAPATVLAQGQPAPTTNAQSRSAADTAGTPWSRQQSLRASRVIGSSVRNPQGQEIGQIEDLVMNLDTGRTRYAVLSFDPGFFHFERVFAVPVERLRMVGDDVVIDIPRERLERSGIESAGWNKEYFQDRRRIARLDSNWGLGEAGSGRMMRLSDLMRSRIVSQGGDTIGSVDDVVFTPGRQQVQYVVVDFDRGWLGGDKRAAVDVRSLHSTRGSGELALVADQATVQRMRPFTEDRYSYFGNGDFVNRERTRGS